MDSRMAAKDRARRFPIRLPSWHEKRLIWWAACKAVSKTGLAQNTLQARIEANDPQIEAMVEELARDRGISVSELKRSLLDDAGFVLVEDDTEEI